MNKRLIAAALLLEALLIVLFTLPLIRFTPEEIPLAFSHWECPEGRFDEGWGFSPEEGAKPSEVFLESPSLSLEKGDYLLTVEYEAEAAPYTLTVNDAGQTVLTLTADDGTISWVKQEE